MRSNPISLPPVYKQAMPLGKYSNSDQTRKVKEVVWLKLQNARPSFRVVFYEYESLYNLVVLFQWI